MKKKDALQEKCKNEALAWVRQHFFKRKEISLCNEDLKVVWFAYIPWGYKAMIRYSIKSFEYDLYFEVTKSSSGEITAHCFYEFEYIVNPSNEPPKYFTKQSF